MLQQEGIALNTACDIAPPILRKGYDFRFDYNGLAFRAGGSSVTGKEYVRVNDKLVSSKKNRASLSQHDITIEGNDYRIEFEVLSKTEASLACRLYCNNILVKLFAANPKRLRFTRPLFAVCIVLALLINDSVITAIPLGSVLALIAALVAIEIIYPMCHIRIVELAVE